MRALLQRVSSASVAVDNQVIGRIGPGLAILLGVSQIDDQEDASYIVEKTLNLRIFSDQAGKFNVSALNVKAELLVISQFTLYAETRKGRRPGFTLAAPPEQAEPLFLWTLARFRESGLLVQTGRFQAHMVVSIANDGPVTVLLDSADRLRPRRAK